jgi:radical SAM protein with 4Fe4S-binding SPASM domain
MTMSTVESNPIVLWELTRACDLHCHGCPSLSDGQRGTNELSTYESYKTIDQIATLHPRELVITGGDPLERDDLGQIIDYARRRGLAPAVMLSPTSLLTYDAIAHLERNGLTRVIFSVDGSTAAIHESLHVVPGTFALTMGAIRSAESAGMRIEINTLVTGRNRYDLEAIANLIRPFGVTRWNVHFVVPVGHSRELEMLTAAEVESVFETIDDIRRREKFAVRVVEAPHYRRYRLERSLRERLEASVDGELWSDFATYDAESGDSAKELLDSARDDVRSFVYISHAGDVRASEFLPQSAGNLRYRPLSEIYRSADLLVAMRDPDNLKGKCARCDVRHICGGSRARSWAMTGDAFASDPLCAYDAGSAVAKSATSHRPATA